MRWRLRWVVLPAHHATEEAVAERHAPLHRVGGAGRSPLVHTLAAAPRSKPSGLSLSDGMCPTLSQLAPFSREARRLLELPVAVPFRRAIKKEDAGVWVTPPLHRVGDLPLGHMLTR
jgi:hypothetical protein